MKKVLLQDSDNDLLETITIILQEEKYSVLPVLQYKDVATQIYSFHPHLVLLDFRFYGEECIGLCHRLKKDFPLLPIIAMSCNDNIKNDYNQAGFDDFISKPFDIDYLFATLQKYL